MLFSDNFYWLRIEISGFRFQAYVPFFSVTQKFWIFSNSNEHINPSSTSVPSCNTQESKELRLQSVTCLSFASLELVQKWRVYDTKTIRTTQSKHVTKTATHTHQPRPATVVLVNSSSRSQRAGNTAMSSCFFMPGRPKGSSSRYHISIPQYLADSKVQNKNIF